MNTSGLYNFISMGTLLNNFEIDGIYFTDFRIIGFEESQNFI